jgi:ubiquinone/menaquinone biosynthesis C-methylase UbiE
MNKVDTRLISYAAYAAQYDERRVKGRCNEYLERVRFQALRAAIGDGARNRRVLDVGCGTGRGPLLLARLGFTNITALDYTSAMLAIAKQKCADSQAGSAIRLLRGDAFALPFADASFDLVVSLRFVHMFRFSLQREVIAEMARVCRPGGTVVTELESAHKGLFATRYFEQRRVANHQKFNSVWEVRRLFDKQSFANRRVIGALLPKVYSVFQHWPAAGERIEAIARIPPFNWMASELVVTAERRPSTSR